MANLVYRRPHRSETRGFDPFQLMDSLLGTLAPETATQNTVFVPAFDVTENKTGYTFTADLPGVKESDLEISLHGNLLTLTGKRESTVDNDAQGYHMKERSFGTFSRSFTLPEGVDLSEIKADLKDGVLTLVVPKRAEVQPRKISLTPSSPKSNTIDANAKA
jgi:HSP20 family protein